LASKPALPCVRHMRAVTLRGGFGLEHLVLEERPTPVPGPGEVLLRLTAASLNYRDLLMVQGPLQPAPSTTADRGFGWGGHGRRVGKWRIRAPARNSGVPLVCAVLARW
jgi:hypothetical protein